MKFAARPLKIPSEDVKEKWALFCAAAKTAKIKLPKDPEFNKALKQIFYYSDFVARTCTRNPEMLKDFVSCGDFNRPYSHGFYSSKLKKNLSEAKESAHLSTILRRFRLRETVRIAWRDIAGLADLSETMADLSALADSCIEHALLLLYKWACSKYGIPTCNKSEQQLVVLGMGKLGARELNFSSDIDLIFAYPEPGETKGKEKSISNDDFFIRLCRKLINVIGATTSDGMVFRVDMRLRPGGESGPVVLSFDAMEEYYQNLGQEWERYALIKARVVAGDKNAGAGLLNILKPFVYRRYLDYGAYESLRDMKQKIALEVKRKGLKDNIKLGRGGIREIEFFGQIFQLIRGGVVPALQNRTILNTLKTLVIKNYIPKNVGDELEKAYIFLRNTEHRLQEFADQQTHDLPQNSVEKERLAASMGFIDWNSFLKHLDDHRKNVSGHFVRLLETEKSGNLTEKEEELELKSVWQGLTEDNESRKTLSMVGFDDQDKTLRALENLRNAPATRALSRESRERLDRLIPMVLKKAGVSKQPSLVLNRILELIKTIERRSCYISLLLENPTTLIHLVELSNASSWIILFLSKHPVLLDELIDPRTLFEPPEKDELKKELNIRLEPINSKDLEYQLEGLCFFKQVNVLRVAAIDVTGALPIMKVSDHLTAIAETVLNKVLELSWNHLIEKHGKPTCLLDEKLCDKGFAVIAYGKLGGIELGYGSDLDLVFLHAGTTGLTNGGGHSIDNAQFFARLGQRVIHILSARTSAGNLYETDMRLRPSGSSGLLVSHVEAFNDYQTEKAWTWEHQAMVRARAISGDILIAKRFEQIRKTVLARPRNKHKLQQEVYKMRERMRKELLKSEQGIFDLKQDTGGIVDIEFLIQYLVLLKSHEYHELLIWTDNVRLLQTMEKTGILDTQAANILKEGYLEYRTDAHRLSLQEKPARVPENKFRRRREKIEKIWHKFIS